MESYTLEDSGEASGLDKEVWKKLRLRQEERVAALIQMGDNKNQMLQHNQVFDVSVNMLPQGGSKCFDDYFRLKRTGTVWTASDHIITAVIGSGVLSLAWAIAQLGWVAGPAVMFLFSLVTYYTSTLLSACYRSGDPDTVKRNYTYMDVVQANLGGSKVKICGYVQYLNLFGVAIGYTIASSISMMAAQRSNYHKSGGKGPCLVNSNPYMIAFGIAEIIFSIGLCLGIAKVAETGTFIGTVTEILGDIAFAYSVSLILTEIQDTVRSPHSESKTMKKATIISVAVTTVFYMLCGCMGYAAFGDLAPGNLLTGFGFYNPDWLLDIANVAIVVHLVGAYQVSSTHLDLMKRPPFRKRQNIISNVIWRSTLGPCSCQLTVLWLLRAKGASVFWLDGPDFHVVLNTLIFNTFVFCQVMVQSSPPDKHTLVKHLRITFDEVVTVTGDGTSDAPVLHEADFELAMGIARIEVLWMNEWYKGGAPETICTDSELPCIIACFLKNIEIIVGAMTHTGLFMVPLLYGSLNIQK